MPIHNYITLYATDTTETICLFALEPVKSVTLGRIHRYFKNQNLRRQGGEDLDHIELIKKIPLSGDKTMIFYPDQTPLSLQDNCFHNSYTWVSFFGI